MSELAQLMVLELQQRCTEQRHAELSFQSVFHSTHVPSISMWDYVRRIAKYSGCTPECFIFSIILIDRYCAATGIPTTFRNIHRLSITAVMISAKLRDDVYYSNAYYASIGGVSNRELNHLEMEMLATINWFTWVEPSHYDGLLEHLKQVYGSFISPQKGH
ncbi:unnamed protein product [Phytomonas sp. EM1]|nr:unnamed protein product [Phytomonas sp. EM1]|eukprot:CCW62749.1 unnamed protein product [Phytomonas sp. isolate EM1]